MTHDFTLDDENKEKYEGREEAEEHNSIVYPESRSAVVDGTPVRFNAYISGDDEGLVWRIGDKSGLDAMIDVEKSRVFLPQGRRIIFNGDEVSYVDIPRYLSESLREDFNELKEKDVGMDMEEWNEKDISEENDESEYSNGLI